MQCRYDEGVKPTAPRVVTRAVGWAHQAGVVSLLDWTERQWRALNIVLGPLLAASILQMWRPV